MNPFTFGKRRDDNVKKFKTTPDPGSWDPEVGESGREKRTTDSRDLSNILFGSERKLQFKKFVSEFNMLETS